MSRTLLLPNPVATAIKASPAPQPPASGIRYCTTCLAVYRQDFQRCPLDGASLVVEALDPWVGSTVGAHYVIDGLVGEGAMGRVYRAHHRDLPDRHYAIKILIGDLAATAQMRTRFQLEAEHASKLAHPNVVGVIDYGATEHGVNYIVMDLVEGPSLGSIVMRGPMDPEHVIKLARQLALGLEHAHSRGMIHRDFKPDNILLIGDGDLEVARIADFGLSLSMDTEVRLTTTGIVCTPAYAAPEQLRSQAIDHRVDLYALGTTMFEMLSGGILPFNHSDVDTSVRSKLVGEAPSILMVAPNVPPALVSIIGRLLSAEPGRRPRSARAVIRALDGAVAAPRAAIKTDPTARLRAPQTLVPDAPARNSNVEPVVTPVAPPSPMPGDATSSTTSAWVVPTTAAATPSNKRRSAGTTQRTRRRPFSRVIAQLFAAGITVGGIVAWLDLRGPSAEQARGMVDTAVAESKPAIAAMREPMSPKWLMAEAPVARDIEQTIEAVEQFVQVPAAPAVAPAAPAAPVESVVPSLPAPTVPTVPTLAPPSVEKRVTKKPAKKAARPAKPVRTSRATPAPLNAELLAADFADTTEMSPASLARRYGAIGRQLKSLDGALGRENTDDLWTAYHTIRIREAMTTVDAREEAASALALIAEAILDRAPAR